MGKCHELYPCLKQVQHSFIEYKNYMYMFKSLSQFNYLRMPLVEQVFCTTDNWSAYIFLCVLHNYVAELNTAHGTDMLLKFYNSVFKENNLMSQCIISVCLLPFAEFLHVSELLYIKRSDIIFESCYVSIFIPKSKTDIYCDGNTVIIS